MGLGFRVDGLGLVDKGKGYRIQGLWFTGSFFKDLTFRTKSFGHGDG